MPFNCANCDKVFPSRALYESHRVAAHGAPELACGVEDCTATFTDIANRHRHRLSAHGITRGATSRPSHFVCGRSGCTYATSRSDNVKRHQKKCKAGPALENAIQAALPAVAIASVPAAALAAPVSAPAPVAAAAQQLVTPMASILPGNSQDTAIVVDKDGNNNDKDSAYGSTPSIRGSPEQVYAPWTPEMEQEPVDDMDYWVECLVGGLQTTDQRPQCIDPRLLQVRP